MRNIPDLILVGGAAIWTEATNPVFKPEDHCSRELPEVIFTRYPRMAKYLNTPTAPGNPVKQVIFNHSTVHGKAIVRPSTPPRELAKAQTRAAGSGCPADVVIPGNEITEPGNEVERPIFELVSPKSVHEEVHVQGNTMESKIVPDIYPERSIEGTVSRDGLVRTAGFAISDTGPVKLISPRRRLPERYAIPVTAQRNEIAVQKLGTVDHGVPDTGKTEEELLMEQLTLIDERFSRESTGKLNN